MSNVAQEEEQQIGSDTDSDVTPTATTAAAHKADLEYSEGGEGVAGVLLETAESRRPAAPALSLRPGLQNDALLLTTVAARETPESSTIEHPKVDQSNGGDDDNERESTAKHLLPPLPSSSSTSSSYKPPKRAPVNKSARIGSLQTIFTDSQKIAYVGLCYLSLHLHKSSRLANKTQIKARRSFDEWAKMLMEKLYAYIGVSLEGE